MRSDLGKKGLRSGFRRLLRFLGLKVLLRGGREVRRVRSARSLRGGRPSSDKLLGLGSVVTDILLRKLGSLCCVLGSNLSKLLTLGVDDIAGLLQVVVDELLVGLVNEGRKEDDGGGDQGKAPVRDNLDKPVGDKSTDGGLFRW